MRLAAISFVCSLAQAATVQGIVHDSQSRPVAAATVYLQAKGAKDIVTVHTDSEGHYRFAMIPGGAYTMRVALDAVSFDLAANEAKHLDLTLASAFFDEPQFVVAGVADPSNLGGHGSDSVWRSTEALAKATESLGKQPDNRGNALEAARELQSASEKEPNEANLFNWGADLLKHRATAPAMEVFIKGNRAYPHSARMLLGLGAALYARGDETTAALRFIEASDLNPGDAAPYSFLGILHSAGDGVIDRLARFARLDPGNAMANYFYAASLWKRGPDTRALTLLATAIQLDPTLAAAHLQLGIVYADLKDFPKAITAFEKAIAAGAAMEEAHYRLAQACRHTGDEAKAKTELELFRKLSAASSDQAERERKQIQDFIIALRNQTPSP